MSKRYSGFSKREHAETARAINEICAQLNALSKRILVAYGVSSPAGKESERLVRFPNVMNRLKSKLDDAYFGEHYASKPSDSPYYDGGGRL